MRLAATAFLLSLLPVAAYSAPPPGMTIDPAIQAWFEGQHDGTGMSCCGTADGHLLEADQWTVGPKGFIVIVDGKKRDVPAVAAQSMPTDPQVNPTGGAVIWLSQDDGHSRIYCFRAGTLA